MNLLALPWLFILYLCALSIADFIARSIVKVSLFN